MEPMTMMAIGAVAAPAIGGLVGNLMGAGDRKRADQAIQKALAELYSVDLPDTEKMKLALQSPEVQGILQPYIEQAQQLQGTSMEDISVDPRLREAQMQALSTLSKMGEEGLTATDRAALNQARRQVAGDEQSRQNAILQNLAQRGAGGSGMELAARLQSSQESADRASQESDRLMAIAQQRMLEAISGAGSLGGQIRGQEFGEQSDIARAKDAIAQFNLQQSAAAQKANIAAMNQAQQQNLAEKQRIHEAGVATSNAQQQYNKELAQKDYENRMARAQAIANAQLGAAGNYQAKAGSTGQMWSGIGSGIGTGLMGASTMMGKGSSAPEGKMVNLFDSEPVNPKTAQKLTPY